MESLTDYLYNRAIDILREVEEEGGGTMRYIKSGKAKMRIEESSEKKQGRINLGREVVVGVNRYRIEKDDEDNGNGNGDGNKGGEDVADALRIDNAAVKESHIRRLG